MNTIATGTLIAQARKERNLTQGDLAAALHVSVQAVSKWERGLNFPDITLLEPLGELLGLTVAELMAGERDTPPQEALLQDSLRLGAAQSGRAKKWRRLFIGAAGVLLALVLGFGYLWVRDHTDWLPQTDTIITPIEIGEMDSLIAHLSGQRCLAAYELTLADGLEEYGVRIEDWDENGLVSSTDVMTLRPAGVGDTRRQTLAFSFQEEGDTLTAAIFSGGCSTTPFLGTIPEDIAWGAMTYDDTSVIGPGGQVLLYIAISTDRSSISIPASLDPTDLEPGRSAILLRLFAK